MSRNSDHWKQKHKTPDKDRLPVTQKMAYGAGGLGEFFFANIVAAMAIPIFAIAMKMDPALLGIALAATKLVGALADPFVGILSDKTRSRWGRRKPYILASAAIGAILLPFIWVVPEGSQFIRFAYVIGTISVFYLFHSLFAVPYFALGYELTSDYDERTRVFAWKNYIGIIGTFAAAWFYWFTLRPVFGNEIIGVRWLSVIGGAVIVICAIIVSRNTREIGERRHVEQKNTIPVFQALKQTFSNRAFLLVQGAILVVALGTGVDGTIGMYLHVHYTCAGNKEFASLIGGWGGTLTTPAIFLIAMPLGLWISTHIGKREAALTGMGIMLVGAISIIWLLNPVLPWLVICVWVMSTIGSRCSDLMYGSMVADICDEDELKTGERREGSYAAAGSFLGKTMGVLVLLLGGFMPRLAGYTDPSVAPTMEQLLRMKTLLIVTDVVGIALAMVLLWFYPLTRKRTEATRRKLEERQNVAG